MRFILTGIVMMLCLTAFAQDNDSLQADSMKTLNLGNVTVTSRAGARRLSTITPISVSRPSSTTTATPRRYASPISTASRIRIPFRSMPPILS